MSPIAVKSLIASIRPVMRFCQAFVVILVGATLGPSATATDAWFDPEGIHGSLILCGGGPLPDVVRDEFVRLAGGKSARLVVIPTASDDDTVLEDAAEVAEIWKARGILSVTTFHTRLQHEANDPLFVEPLRQATAVWITGGKQTQIAASYSGTLVEDELRALLRRGGVIGGTSAGAACHSRVMIVRGRIHETPGLGLVPDVIIDQHFLARDRKARLLSALEQHPDLVGFGIDEGTALVIRGRSLQCLGDSTVSICFGATDRLPISEEILKPGQHSDLTMVRRAARARMASGFPPAGPVSVEVQRGALVVVGGGKIPVEIAERFIALAGGPEAPIVLLPTANPDPLPDDLKDRKLLQDAGARNLRILKQRRREEVESPSFLEELENAKGIWFAGGRQWRFVDAYEATKAVDAFREVLRRGGVIGGTSAGATIQGEFLVRGSPLGNEQMICPGYNRGFGFLPGVAIDQHVAERKRFADLTQVVAAYPQLLGIGLDESTALVVEGHMARVVGRGKAYFHNRLNSVAAGAAPNESLSAGEQYNLLKRERFRTN